MLHFAIFAASAPFFVLNAFLACLLGLPCVSAGSLTLSAYVVPSDGQPGLREPLEVLRRSGFIRCRGHREMQSLTAHTSGLRGQVHNNVASQPNNRNARKAMKPPDTREDHVCLVAFSSPVCPGCLGFNAKQLTTCARKKACGCILAALACLMRLRTCPPWGKTSRAASAGHVC